MSHPATRSGGKQQRLAIARVLPKKPAWVLADEATSALDEDAESTRENAFYRIEPEMKP